MRNVVRGACVAAAVLAAIAGQAIVANPAHAITGLVRAAEDSVLDSNDKDFDVDCPGGTVVTGGAGYLVASSPSPKGKVGITGIRPQPDHGGVQVIAREADVNFASNWRAVAVALCAPEPAGYEIVEEPSAGGTNTSQSAVAECSGANGRVIGAGAYVTGANRKVFLESMVPSGDLTSVTAVAHETQSGTASAWTVTAVAVCADTPGGLELYPSSTTPASVDYDSMSRVCPSAKEMYGTGFSIDGGAGQVLLHGLNVVPETTIRLAATEDANGYGSNWSMTTYALCAS